MGERTHPDNCLWIFCCCGCLPIIGIIKGTIIVAPIFIISLLGFTGVAIILLPHDIFLTYKAICKTSIIGINLKILCMLLLPIALISWPILVALASTFYGILYGLFGPTIYTFDSDYNLLCGGMGKIFEDTCEFIGEFWDFNYNAYFNYLSEMQTRKVDNPFDINIIQIIIGLILAGYGSVVGTIVSSLLWFIKLFPSIYRLYAFLFEEYCGINGGLEMLMYSILFLIAFSLIPAAGVLAILGYIGYGFYGGIYCAIEGYKHNIGRGIISIWNTIYDIDTLSNSLIFGRECSCFPDCKEKCLKKDKPNPDNKKKKNDNEKNEPSESNKNNSAKENLIVNQNQENQDNSDINEKEKEENTNLNEEEKQENIKINAEENQENTYLKVDENQENIK